MEQLGIGIIGTGHIARSHLRSLKAHPPARVVGVYDVIPERAQAAAQEFEVPFVAPSLEALLERSDIDAVIVATPPYAHKDPTIAALKAGKHVLCEKPFALDPSEAEEMTRTAEQAGKYLAVCSARQRCGAAARRAHELVVSGALGKVYHARSSAYRVRGRPGIDILRENTWFIDKKLAGGGALIDIGVYQIDKLLWLLGNPRVTNVLATTFMGIGTPAPAPLVQDVEDHATVMFTCDNGASGILEIAWASNISGVDTFIVLGSEAGLRFNPLTLITAGRYSRNAVEERLLNVPDGDTTGFGDVSQQFVNAILAGREPYTPARDALEVTRVIDAAYRSAETGKPVSLL